MTSPEAPSVPLSVGRLFTSSATPTLSAGATDGDGNTVRLKRLAASQ
ncbi:MAG: hypothetical protein M3P23_02845 [Actinomycetota bacterium]|nr:hypothetical protein [Actinomycetota bacterium]